MKVECDNCGSVYLLGNTKSIFRDKDSLKCRHCGATLYSWNEARLWHIEEEVSGPKISNPDRAA